MTTINDPVEPFVIERTFNAPAALVWRALTNKEDMARWYFDLPGFKAEAGCEFEFVVQHEGNTYHHLCKVTEVIPQTKISYTWRYKGYEGDSLVTFELFDEGGKTKLKLTHSGLETFPKLPQFARKNFVGGWTHLVGTSLPNFLSETLAKPFVMTREFNAPRELVWKAWTEREHMTQWFGPKGFTISTANMDFRAGGSFHYCIKNPQGMEMWGKFVYCEITPPERLTWEFSFSDKDGGSIRHPFSKDPWPLSMMNEALFSESGGKTTITLKSYPLDATAEERASFERARGGMTQGWTGTFAQLDEFLAKHSPAVSR